MGNNMGSFQEGFKRARENAVDENGKKFSQKSFAKAFGTSRKNVINWENGVIPRKETLSELCDFFQCDMDYLFNRIDEKTHDMKFIVDHTGLSERAINNVRQLSSDNTIALNTLLEDKDFVSVLSNISTYQEAIKGYGNSYDKFMEGINGLISEIASNTDDKLTKDSARKRSKAEKELQQSDIYLDAMQYKIDSSFQNVIHNLSKDKQSHKKK